MCKLCLITKPDPEIIRIVSLALEAGVEMVQFRCKEGSDSENLELANALSNKCKSYNCLFIVNDRIDIALASEADGVHLGQEDIPIEFAREIVGPDKLIGLSTHSIKQIEDAENEEAKMQQKGKSFLIKILVVYFLYFFINRFKIFFRSTNFFIII